MKNDIAHARKKLGTIQKRYGIAGEEAEKLLNNWRQVNDPEYGILCKNDKRAS